MFAGLGRLAHRWGGWLLLVGVLVSIPLAWRLLPLQTEMDLATLFPRHDPYLERFRYFQDNFGTSDILVAVSRDPSPAAQARVEAFVQWLRAGDGKAYVTGTERIPVPSELGLTVISAFPRRPSTDHDFCRVMLAEIKRYLHDSGTELDLTGGAVIATESIAALNLDISRTSLVSLIGIVLVLLIFIRDPVFPLFALVPLLTGIIWTVALNRFLYGPLSLLTAALPGILAGMGIDYAVYIRNCRREFAVDEPEAWSQVYRRIGPPMLMGVTTTAAALFALCTARLQGLREMGIVGGVGILMIFGLMVFLMPVLLDARRRMGFNVRPPSDRCFEWVAVRVVRHRRAAILLFVLITIPLLYAASRLRYDMNPQSYRDSRVPSVKALDELERDAHIAVEPVLVATQRLADEREALARIRPYVGQSEAHTFALIDSYAERLDRGMTPRIDRFRGQDKRLVAMIFPSRDPYQENTLPAFVATVEKMVGDCQPYVVSYSGMPLLWNQVMRLSKHDVEVTTGVAALVVIVVLGAQMRRLRSMMAALVPIAGSVIWMLGVLELTHVKFSLISAVSMPLVLGLGIGYGVYIVHRLGHDSVEQAVITVGRSIIVSGLTTAVGFFALCSAHNQALAGMGLAAGTGVLSCLLWSLLFLPAWAAEIDHRRQQTAGD